MNTSWFKMLLLLASTAATVLAADSYTIAVIPKGTTHEFWKSIHAGAEKARLELAASGITVNIIWKGPLKEDNREQQALEVFRPAQPAGKSLSCSHAAIQRSFRPMTRRAIATR
jgi:ABC-type sugar transport system substrate-binding protein